MRAFLLLLAACLAGAAEGGQSTLYRYSGSPLQLSYSCGETDFSGPAVGCTQHNPCPVYIELSDAETNKTRIFVSGNFHTEGATLASLLLVSEDGGITWKEAAERLPSAMLEDIQFVGDKTGWVAGAVVQPTARDPFFLLTTDGGVNWRRRTVTTDARSGFIEAYTFESPEAGYVWLDRQRGAENAMRFEMYETQTGGESWMLREISDRKIPRRRSMRVLPDPSWRISSQDDVYEIESRTASGWRKVAAFSIAAGVCTPPEVKEDPLPPPSRPSVQEEEPSDTFRIPTSLPRSAPRKPPTLKD